MKKILKVTNLRVAFNDSVIHQNLSFSVNEGENLTILGPNGSGKSVLVKVLLNILPYSGVVNWGKNIKIGYLPQGFNQLSMKNMPLTVNDFFSLKPQKYSQTQIVSNLEKVGLNQGFLQKNANTLSGGQFQRMLVAWVLIDQPRVVLLDEPTTGIDLGGGENLYSLLHTFQKKQNLTVILITHDLNIVYKYSDHVLCLSQKDFQCYGEPLTILTPKMLSNIFGMDIKFYPHQGQAS